MYICNCFNILYCCIFNVDILYTFKVNVSFLNVFFINDIN